MALITGIVLAGGKSNRFGSDKALAVYGELQLIEYSIHVVQPCCDRVVISANSNNYKHLGYNVVKDNYSNAGPLAGIEASMKMFPSEIYLVASCDIPLINSSIYRKMIQSMKGVQAAVACNKNGQAEPLIAVYAADVYQTIKDHLEKGHFKANLILEKIRCNYITVDDEVLLRNINTLEQLEQIRELKNKA
ncbi:MAG TPA: molybdenum cofactor guanylyltransferase [Bacteroidales bacterium]|nr:molybdenum cofactor guanylyltransferase [Bacteroidales bacterium]